MREYALVPGLHKIFIAEDWKDILLATNVPDPDDEIYSTYEATHDAKLKSNVNYWIQNRGTYDAGNPSYFIYRVKPSVAGITFVSTTKKFFRIVRKFTEVAKGNLNGSPADRGWYQKNIDGYSYSPCTETTITANKKYYERGSGNTGWDYVQYSVLDDRTLGEGEALYFRDRSSGSLYILGKTDTLVVKNFEVLFNLNASDSSTWLKLYSSWNGNKMVGETINFEDTTKNPPVWTTKTLDPITVKSLDDLKGFELLVGPETSSTVNIYNVVAKLQTRVQFFDVKTVIRVNSEIENLDPSIRDNIWVDPEFTLAPTSMQSVRDPRWLLFKDHGDEVDVDGESITPSSGYGENADADYTEHIFTLYRKYAGNFPFEGAHYLSSKAEGHFAQGGVYTCVKEPVYGLTTDERYKANGEYYLFADTTYQQIDLSVGRYIKTEDTSYNSQRNYFVDPYGLVSFQRTQVPNTAPTVADIEVSGTNSRYFTARSGGRAITVAELRSLFQTTAVQLAVGDTINISKTYYKSNPATNPSATTWSIADLQNAGIVKQDAKTVRLSNLAYDEGTGTYRGNCLMASSGGSTTCALIEYSKYVNDVKYFKLVPASDIDPTSQEFNRGLVLVEYNFNKFITTVLDSDDLFINTGTASSPVYTGATADNVKTGSAHSSSGMFAIKQLYKKTSTSTYTAVSTSLTGYASKNPVEEGWYVKVGSAYSPAAVPVTYTGMPNFYSKSGTTYTLVDKLQPGYESMNPASKSWYTKSGNSYAAATATTVYTFGTTFYTKSDTPTYAEFTVRPAEYGFVSAKNVAFKEVELAYNRSNETLTVTDRTGDTPAVTTITNVMCDLVETDEGSTGSDLLYTTDSTETMDTYKVLEQIVFPIPSGVTNVFERVDTILPFSALDTGSVPAFAGMTRPYISAQEGTDISSDTAYVKLAVGEYVEPNKVFEIVDYRYVWRQIYLDHGYSMLPCDTIKCYKYGNKLFLSWKDPEMMRNPADYTEDVGSWVKTSVHLGAVFSKAADASAIDQVKMTNAGRILYTSTVKNEHQERFLILDMDELGLEVVEASTGSDVQTVRSTSDHSLIGLSLVATSDRGYINPYGTNNSKLRENGTYEGSSYSYFLTRGNLSNHDYDRIVVQDLTWSTIYEIVKAGLGSAMFNIGDIWELPKPKNAVDGQHFYCKVVALDNVSTLRRIPSVAPEGTNGKWYMRKPTFRPVLEYGIGGGESTVSGGPANGGQMVLNPQEEYYFCDWSEITNDVQMQEGNELYIYRSNFDRIAPAVGNPSEQGLKVYRDGSWVFTEDVEPDVKTLYKDDKDNLLVAYGASLNEILASEAFASLGYGVRGTGYKVLNPRKYYKLQNTGYYTTVRAFHAKTYSDPTMMSWASDTNYFRKSMYDAARTPLFTVSDTGDNSRIHYIVAGGNVNTLTGDTTEYIELDYRAITNPSDDNLLAKYASTQYTPELIAYWLRNKTTALFTFTPERGADSPAYFARFEDYSKHNVVFMMCELPVSTPSNMLTIPGQESAGEGKCAISRTWATDRTRISRIAELFDYDPSNTDADAVMARDFLNAVSDTTVVTEGNAMTIISFSIRHTVDKFWLPSVIQLGYIGLSGASAGAHYSFEGNVFDDLTNAVVTRRYAAADITETLVGTMAYRIVEEVADTTDKIPVIEGWFVRDDSTGLYTLSGDEEVVSGTTYYKIKGSPDVYNRIDAADLAGTVSTYLTKYPDRIVYKEAQGIISEDVIMYVDGLPVTYATRSDGAISGVTKDGLFTEIAKNNTVYNVFPCFAIG